MRLLMGLVEGGGMGKRGERRGKRVWVSEGKGEGKRRGEENDL